MTLRRIFDGYAYGSGPRQGCWWDETCTLPVTGALDGDITADVAIVGGGFSGLSAALTLAEQGASVVVLEARAFGWGASGRNGGFCCLGGGRASDRDLDAAFGKAARLQYRATERAAVDYVDGVLSEGGCEADRHSRGETVLAHRARDLDGFRRKAEGIFENYGVAPEIIGGSELADHGMTAGRFHGAMTVPLGFGLNPRKYLACLMRAAGAAGVALYSDTQASSLDRIAGSHRVVTAQGAVTASDVVFATNGYSSENMPLWLAGRYMPAQSTVLVTRPLTDEELTRQGWTTDQMCSDSRNLLHYFRLMPDRRFLFGMRGGLLTGQRAEVRARLRTRWDFDRLFPEWSAVESAHSWSGLVCLARRKLPYIGPVPSAPGLWTTMCYHGNGIAMGSFAGHLLARAMLKGSPDPIPTALRTPLAPFPFGALRRAVMPPVYAGLKLQDLG